MYTIVNRRKINRERMQETIERGQRDFFPKLKEAPGFVGFYLVTDTDQGVNTAIVVWDDKSHAAAFADQARAWAQILDEMGHVQQSDNRGETVVNVQR